MIGKALASPESLTTDEIHEVMLWPPPSVVRANIQRATGGTLSTPMELYAKAKDAIDRGQLETMLSEEEISLPARKFYAMDDTTFNPGADWSAIRMPGRLEAIALLTCRLGLDQVVLSACAVYTHDQLRRKRETWNPTAPIPQSVDEIINGMHVIFSHHLLGRAPDQEAIARIWEYLEALQAAAARGPVPHARLKAAMNDIKSLQEEHLLGNMTNQDALSRSRQYLQSLRFNPIPSTLAPIPAADFAALSQSDGFGSGPWPPNFIPQPPIRIFQIRIGLPGRHVVAAWFDLSEDQREAIRAQYETVRRAAWVRHETEQAEQAAYASPPNREQSQDLRWPNNLLIPGAPRERMPGLKVAPSMITGMMLFHDEIGREVEFQEALARWEAFANEQRAVYEAIAKVAEEASRVGYDELRRNWRNNAFRR